jgi:hypothetical protein
MIRIKYKSGWIRFKTIDELTTVSGWSFDKILFALRTRTSILGIELAYGEIKPLKRENSMRRPQEKQPRYIEMKTDLRMVKKRKDRADRIIRAFEDTWFPGRVETNEIKHARAESKRLQVEVDRLKRSIDHYNRYERRRTSATQ